MTAEKVKISLNGVSINSPVVYCATFGIEVDANLYNRKTIKGELRGIVLEVYLVMPVRKTDWRYCSLSFKGESRLMLPLFLVKRTGERSLSCVSNHGINFPQITELKSANYGKIIYILRNFQETLCFSRNYFYLCTHVIKACYRYDKL